MPETRTKGATEPKEQTETATKPQVTIHGVTENVSANTNETASGTDSKKIIRH